MDLAGLRVQGAGSGNSGRRGARALKCLPTRSLVFTGAGGREQCGEEDFAL
jgi:hypothetical protein